MDQPTENDAPPHVTDPLEDLAELLEIPPQVRDIIHIYDAVRDLKNGARQLKAQMRIRAEKVEEMRTRLADVLELKDSESLPEGIARIKAQTEGILAGAQAQLATEREEHQKTQALLNERTQLWLNCGNVCTKLRRDLKELDEKVGNLKVERAHHLRQLEEEQLDIAGLKDQLEVALDQLQELRANRE